MQHSIMNTHCDFSLCHPIVKFGSKRSSDPAKKPGASAASARDVSAAERSKCVFLFSIECTSYLLYLNMLYSPLISEIWSKRK